MVKIVVGIDIEVYENSFPISEYLIDESLKADGVITDAFEKEQNFFTVHIPIYSDQLSIDDKRAVFELIKQEKPVNSSFFVTYKRRNKTRYAGTIIGENTIVQENGIKS